MSAAPHMLQLRARDHAIARRAELHAAWRAACEEVSLAYAHWCAAPSPDRPLAHAIYCAAADREAAAADHLRRAAVT